MELITVNNAIDNLETLNGKYLYIEGLLIFEFENISINHWPKAERREPAKGVAYFAESSIWLEVGSGAFSFNVRVLSRWSGKRVVVGGTLQKADSLSGGAGHMSGWPAEILATQIELLKEWQRKI